MTGSGDPALSPQQGKLSVSDNANAASHFVDRHASTAHQDKVAFLEYPSGRSISYAELASQSARFAGLLGREGIRPDERLVMLVLDQIEFPVVFWGAMKAGVIPVPLNTLLSPDIYRFILNDCEASALVVSDALLEVVRPVIAEISSLKSVFVIGGKNHEGCLDLSGELDRASPKQTIQASGEDCAFWLYSSGSTGQPKGVRHRHRSLRQTAETYGASILKIAPADRVFSAAKLFFAYGLGNAMTFPLSVGATAILCPERPTAGSVAKLLHELEPTIFFGVPTLYSSLCAAMDAGDIAPPTGLRLCVSAGEAMPESVGAAWSSKVGCEILDGVGSTEMLHIFLSNVAGDVQYGTSGVPVPGYEVRLADENGQDVGDGVVGELLVKGESSAADYWNLPEKSVATFQGAWTHTGDKFIRREDGRYEFCGRNDEMFKVSGIWVSPFEVEQALASHPDVIEAAVVSRRDAEGLEKPHAFVVLRSDAGGSGIDAQLKQHVKDAVGKWKYPRWISVVDSLPKTATGKTQRYRLREAVASLDGR